MSRRSDSWTPLRTGRLWLSAATAVLLGAAVYFVVFGYPPLDPQNQGWLWAEHVDPVQLWLGWTYFRHAPWALPPGGNPDYGLELGTAIYFADAIPLLALPLKALRGVLDVPQYVGPWLLACGMLQGILGWLLVGHATRDLLARACGAGLLALQPMLIHRMLGHTPLAAQWTLLAALILVFGNGRGARPRLAWAVLLAITSLVHSNLLAMVMLLWATDWLRRAWSRQDRFGIVLEAAIVPGTVSAGLWLGGFFLLHGGYNTGPGHEWGGYGTWGFDLLAFLDGGAWSSILPDLPDPGHWEAGSSYLGMGGLVLLSAGVLALLRQRSALPRRLWPLAGALLLLLALAITHRLSIAGHVWTLFAPSAGVLSVLELIRNSERLVWPLAYALMVGSIAAAARAWGGRRTGQLLLGLLLLQWIDLGPGLVQRRAAFAGAPAGVPQRLSDPFWADAARTYTRMRAVPAANLGDGWEALAPFAASAGLPTDAIYMARVDPAAVAALRAKVAAMLASGTFEPGTFYVLRDEASLALARAAHVGGRDLILQADGFWILAPGWCGLRRAAGCADQASRGH